MRTGDVVGLIPCAGYATRIAPIPCSKEILPIGLGLTRDGSVRTKVVSHHLLERMHVGGVRKAFFILRNGKWDIPSYYGDGASLDMNLGYLMMGLPYGAPYTLDQAYPFVRGKRIALGFPDILLEPRDAFKRAFSRLKASRADLVLGLFPVRDTRFADMIRVDRAGKVSDLLIKPDNTKLKFGWAFAVWTSSFSDYLHEYLALPRTSAQEPAAPLPAELSVGHVIQAAIHDKIPTQSVTFPRGRYLDIGTPEGLNRAMTKSKNNW